MKTTIEILKEARDLIAQEGKWTQGYYAYDSTGEEAYTTEDAVCFCAVGAISVVAGGAPHDDCGMEAVRALRSVVGGDVPEYNDEDGRTQAEVVAKFDEAIAAEEAKAVTG